MAFSIDEACVFVIGIIFMKQIRKKKLCNLNKVDISELISDRGLI